MTTPSAHNMPTAVCSSQVASLKQPQSAYKQVLAKLRVRLIALRIKAKKGKKPTTGGQLAPVVADAEKFGHPNRAIFLPDAYYGWGHTAKSSAKFITGLFDCPSTLPGTGPEYPNLAEFIAYALFLCQFEPEVNDHAMYLLWRSKCKHPDFKPTHGHGVYLAALSLAVMVAHEDCSFESWAMVGQWIFSAKQLEINQECLGGLLIWKLGVDPEEMATTMEHVHRGEQPDAEPIPLLPNCDSDDCASSTHSINTSFSLSTCSIPSIWSLRSVHRWDEWSHNDLAVKTMSGEKVNANPYPDLKH